MNYLVEKRTSYKAILAAVLVGVLELEMVKQTYSQFELVQSKFYDYSTGKISSLGSWVDVIVFAILALVFGFLFIACIITIREKVYVLDCPNCHRKTEFSVGKNESNCVNCHARLVKRDSSIDAIPSEDEKPWGDKND